MLHTNKWLSPQCESVSLIMLEPKSTVFHTDGYLWCTARPGYFRHQQPIQLQCFLNLPSCALPGWLLVLFPLCNLYFCFLWQLCYGMFPIPPSLDKTSIVYLFIWNQFFLFQQKTGPQPAKMVLKWLKGQKERTTYFTSCEQGYCDHTKPVTPGTI